MSTPLTLPLCTQLSATSKPKFKLITAGHDEKVVGLQRGYGVDEDDSRLRVAIKIRS